MKRIQFALQGGLERKDLEQIHREVLDVLREVGVECRHDPTLGLVAGHKGITVREDRIFFSPELVNEYIERFRERNAGPNWDDHGDEIRILSGAWNCLNIEDMETGELRPPTARDVQDTFKLVHVADCWPICPVWPFDVPRPLQLLYMEKTGIELTESTGSLLEFSDEGMLEFAIAMYQAAGRKYVIHVQFPISPLRMNPLAFETIWKYMDRTDVELNPLPGPIPQAGLTAPLPAPALLVQELAETFAGCILIDKISNGRFFPAPDFRVDLFDMRYMNPVSATSPEYVLWQLVLKDVCEYFTGRPKTWHTLGSMAKRCDIHAMLDKLSLVLTLALGGFRDFFFAAGQLSSAEVFSPAQFVIDFEIARYVTHIVRGLAYDDRPGASLEVIRDVGSGGQYLTHPTTLAGFREFFESDLFPRTNLEQWRAAEEPDVWRTAADKAREMIESYDRPPLSPSVQEEIDRIYAEAEAYAAGKGGAS